MQFITNNKMYIIGVAVAVAALWGYMTFFSSTPSDATLTTDQAASPLPPDVLATLSLLTSIRLDAGLFQDPIFKSLSDYGVAIPDQPAGRRNPFAPL